MESNKVILHCDCDNYFATVEEKYNPALKKIPFAVCGDPEMRHSIVMAKNSLAKRAGVQTGISYRQAQQICPGLGYVKADFSKYLTQTQMTRTVFLKYAELITPYGMDESWIPLMCSSFREAEQIAELIRIEIMYSLGLSASLGVSFNHIFAKIASDYCKPNAITIITKDNYKNIVWPLPASKLLFVGEKRRQLLLSIGISTIGDIARSDPERLRKLIGKAGHDLWCYANGDDRNFRPNSDGIGSIGNTITPPADLENNEEAAAIIYLLVTSICTRLRKHKLRTSCISVCMRDNAFNKVIRQCSFKINTDSVNYIFNQAYSLFTKFYKWERPLRSIGVRAEQLDGTVQLALFPYDECELCIDIDTRIKELTRRFGPLQMEKSATSKGWWPCAEDTLR